MERSIETATRRPLGEVLVERGVVEADALEALLVTAGANHARLGSQCLELGLADEPLLARALAEQQGHPCLVLSSTVIDLRALELVPRVVASQHRLLPVAIDDEHITLAAADIGERDIFTHVSFASGRRVELLLALDGPLARATQDAYEALLRRERTLPGAAISSDADTPRLFIERADSTRDASDAVSELIELADVVSDKVPAASATSQPLVLVVDDEDDVRGLLLRLLRHDGYRVAEAPNGRVAMEHLRRERPSVVLLDAMLPEIHGFEICRAIKHSETLRDIPVVMISAVYRGWENAREIQEVHLADAFVEKPFDVHYVRELVARMLGTTAPRPDVTVDRRRDIARARTAAAVSYKMGDLADAVGAIERWCDLDPFDPDAYLLLGNVHTRQKDLDGAMRAYERAATFGPTLFAAFKNLALTYEQLGFLSRAFASWFRAAELTEELAVKQHIHKRLHDRYRSFF